MDSVGADHEVEPFGASLVDFDARFEFGITVIVSGLATQAAPNP